MKKLIIIVTMLCSLPVFAAAIAEQKTSSKSQQQESPVTSAVNALQYKECKHLVDDVASWFVNPNSNGDYYAQTTDEGGFKEGTLSIFFEVDGGLGHVLVSPTPKGCHITVIEQNASNMSCNYYLNGVAKAKRKYVQNLSGFKVYQNPEDINTVQTLRNLGNGCSSYIATTLFVPH